MPTANGCQTGTRALALAVKHVYPELASLTSVYGCFNRRKARGAATWSLHAEGRAFDVGVPGREHETGWQLACELVELRIAYGVQRVIWDGHIWSIEQPAGWRKLQPTSLQHLDHLHVEQYRAASQRAADCQTQYEESLARGRAAHAAKG
jgi:uncharacterized protein YcbK (DUF882 family)